MIHPIALGAHVRWERRMYDPNGQSRLMESGKGTILDSLRERGEQWSYGISESNVPVLLDTYPFVVYTDYQRIDGSWVEEIMNMNREPLLLPRQAASLHEEIDWQEFVSSFLSVMVPAANVFISLFQTIGEAFTPALEQLAQAVAAAVDIVRRAYTDAGAPYGPTAEGMLRWIKEQKEANNDEA